MKIALRFFFFEADLLLLLFFDEDSLALLLLSWDDDVDVVVSVGASAVDENNAMLSAPFIAILLVEDMLLVEGAVKADATAIAAAKATSLMTMVRYYYVSRKGVDDV